MILLILLALSQPQIDCEMVRAKVGEYGRIRALAWAVAHGFSAEQIREARKCLAK